MTNNPIHEMISIVENLKKEDDPSDNLEIGLIAHRRYRYSLQPPAICRHVVIFFPYDYREKFDFGKRPGDFFKRTDSCGMFSNQITEYNNE